MRNLKKVLAMALALVMSLSLVTIANAADFSDDADISYKEAVDVMSAIGVINGYEDGSFQPEGILTREEAAKLICTMLLGENADRLGTSSSSFTDVAATRWSAPSIEYCVQTGIIAGNGDGTFDPEGELTGYAFAKMLLVALGYDSTVEGYTGAGWTINVAADATTAGIDVDGVLMSNQVTREVAAQMALNTLEATMVSYSSKGTNITLPDGTTVNTGASAPEAIANLSGDYREVDADAYLQFCERYFDDLKLNNRTSARNAFGAPSQIWVYDGEDVGTYTQDADYSIVVSSANHDANYWLEEIDNDLSIVGTDPVVVNGDVDQAASVDLLVGDIVDFYSTDDDDDDMEIVVVTRYTADVIEEVDTDVTDDDADDGVTAYITFENAGTFNNTDITGYSANVFEENAVVAIIEGSGNYAGEIIASYVTESVEGAISAYSSTTYTMDGTRYRMVGGIGSNDEINGQIDFDEGEYRLYLDSNGYVLKAEVLDGTASINDVFYLDDINSGNVYWTDVETSRGQQTTYYYVQAVYLDGTTEELEVASVANSNTARKGAIETYLNGLSAGFYSDNDHSVNNGDYDVALSAWTNNTYTASADLGSSIEITSSTRRVGSYYLNSSTRYVVVESYTDNDDFAVTVRNDSISYEGTSGDKVYVIYSDSNGSNVANYVVIVSDTYSAAATGDYIYVADDAYDSVSGGREYTVYNKDGEEVDIVVDSDSTVRSLAEGNYYEYAVLANGNYDIKGTLDDAVVTTYVGSYNDLLSVAGNSEDIDTADAVIVDVHDTDEADQYNRAIESLSAMQRADERGYIVTLHIVYTDSDNDTAEMIVVESAIYRHSDPTASEIEDALAATGSATVTGTMPAGSYGDYDEGTTVTVTMDGTTTVSGETAIYGDTTVTGETTLRSGGTLTTVQLNIADNGVFVIEDNSTFEVLAISMDVGSAMEFTAGSGIGFIARDIIFIDFSNNTVNGISFSGGINGALTAANGAGLGDWYALD